MTARLPLAIFHVWPITCLRNLNSPTWSSIHGLDLLPRLQVPEADVSIQGAGGSDGAVVTDVHRDHT